MSRLRGSYRRARRLVFSRVPFCQGEEGTQNQVCVPISAFKWGQLTNSEPRSKVIGRPAIMGRSLMAFMIFSVSADCCAIACRAEYDRFGALIRVLENDSEATNALHYRRYICLASFLFKHHQSRSFFMRLSMFQMGQRQMKKWFNPTRKLAHQGFCESRAKRILNSLMCRGGYAPKPQ